MILALDSSTAGGSVALIDRGVLKRELFIESPRGRGGALFEALDALLADAGDLARVVVGTGPGSYNGIRSALAVGWGVAEARRVPLVGVSSLLGLEKGRRYAAVGDARRGQFYFALVENGGFQREPSLYDRNELLRELALLEGVPVFVPGEIDFLPQALVRLPQACLLGILGEEQELQGGIPEPLYLKPAFVNTTMKVLFPEKQNAR